MGRNAGAERQVLWCRALAAVVRECRGVLRRREGGSAVTRDGSGVRSGSERQPRPSARSGFLLGRRLCPKAIVWRSPVGTGSRPNPKRMAGRPLAPRPGWRGGLPRPGRQRAAAGAAPGGAGGVARGARSPGGPWLPNRSRTRAFTDGEQSRCPGRPRHPRPVRYGAPPARRLPGATVADSSRASSRRGGP
jgi:hypothetical protein